MKASLEEIVGGQVGAAKVILILLTYSSRKTLEYLC